MAYLCLQKLKSNGHRLHNQMIDNNTWVSSWEEASILFIQIMDKRIWVQGKAQQSFFLCGLFARLV